MRHRRIFGLILSTILALLWGCQPGCRTVCEHNYECFGYGYGNIDRCVSLCEADEYEQKPQDLECLASATCDELAQGVCAPTCESSCDRIDQCGVQAPLCLQVCQQSLASQSDDSDRLKLELDCVASQSCDALESQCSYALSQLTVTQTTQHTMESDNDASLME